MHNPNTGSGAGFCLEIHDLAVSKLVAGREKDMEFLRGLLRHNLARAETIWERLNLTPLDDARRALCSERLKRLQGL